MSDPESQLQQVSPEVELKTYTPPNPHQVLRIALNLKALLDGVFPTATPVASVGDALTPKIVRLAYQACGGKGNGEKGTSSRKYRSCIVFCLLIVTNWYHKLASVNLHDSELYVSRGAAAEQLAKLVIDEQNRKDEAYLFIEILCRRFLICLNGENTTPASALELAVDNHLIVVISSSGYQRCIKWMWRGWIIQLRSDPRAYIMYKDINNTRFISHFNPNRIKSPKYQNIMEIGISFVYLCLYTYLINQHEKRPGFAEVLFYLFTLSFSIDEATKFYHIGSGYFRSFLSCFNDTMYAVIALAFGFRLFSITYHSEAYNQILYKILSCVAPLMWTRLLFYLDSQRFIGAIIVVIQKMMKESILFFTLLFVVIVGFLQGFIGMDLADGKRDKTKMLFHLMVRTIIGGADFGLFEALAPPYSGILYYVFVFIITVILLNILGALFNSSYALIVAHSTDEYLALNSAKTLKYVRSPDLDLYIPPFNLFEIVFLTLPLSWWTPTRTFKKINFNLLLVVYAPFLFFIAIHEVKNAKRVQYNRFKKLPDDSNEHDMEFDLEDGFQDESLLDVGADDASAIESNTNAIQSALDIQRAFERQDPEFMVQIEQFDKKLKDLASPIQESKELGVSWEAYELRSKIDKLTELVGALYKENQEIKQKLN